MESVSSNAGKDIIKGGKGNDTIYADDGYKDVIDCGGGTDHVYFNKGLDRPETTCEKRHAVYAWGMRTALPH